MHTTDKIRNIVFIGHSGCGKTSLIETMLFEGGAITRKGKVEDGSTVSDHTNIEKEKGNSLFSTLMHVKWRENKINILDTPGSDDFIGEVVSAMKVADTAIMVLNGAHGVEVGNEILWEYVENFNTPSLFVINQIDHDKCNFQNTFNQALERFGSRVTLFQYPLNEGIGFNKIIDALKMVMYHFPDGGGKPQKTDIPATEMPRALELHNLLVEAAAEHDETLMEKYFQNGSLTEEELASGLSIALSKRKIIPVFCTSAVRNMGTGRLMGFLNDICPSPAHCPPALLANGTTLNCSTADPNTTLFIYKTITEPQVGIISYFKVYSGTIKNGDELKNLQHGHIERINQLFVAEGKTRTPVASLNAGDIGVVVKLKDAHTNETLASKNSNNIIMPISWPDSRIRCAVVPPSKNDMEKLMKALLQIHEEDPTLIIEQNAQFKQLILHGQGQLHLDLIKYRIEKVYSIAIQFEKPRIAYMETITKSSDEVYRHKKQSGGAGQFAEVHMRVEPYFEGMSDPSGLTVRSKDVEVLPWGGSLAFYWCIVGGSIDAKYINAIKKGIMQKMEHGPLTGSRCKDIRVSIYDGKMHSVDSNDMAFMLAASNAFKAAFKSASPQLLEPIYELTVLCNDNVMGDVMGDLQTRRAVIIGMGNEGHYQQIKAKVPQAEMYQYSSALRALTQGKAKFARHIAEYAAVPNEIQQKLIAEHIEELNDVAS